MSLRSPVLIDSHCHLDLAPFDPDRTEVLARASAAGVVACLVPAVDRAHWNGLEQIADYAGKPGIFPAIGLHPCFDHETGDLDALAERLAAPHPFVAIGECGLDAVGGKLDMPRQLALCAGQLSLARQHQLPVILHVRKAHNELLTLLARHPLPAGGMVHGFSGSLDLARQYLRHGLKIGVGGGITYERAAKSRATVAALPLEALVLETDSPDMPLAGWQGQRNEPSRLPQVLDALAQLRQSEPEKLAQNLFLNTQSLFPRAEWYS